jgi:hypothetical protein
MDARSSPARHIEHALRRHLGVFIDVELMLRSGPYARDVLTVCDTIGQTELPELARQYRAAGAEAARAAIRAAARSAVDVPCGSESPGRALAPAGTPALATVMAAPRSGNWLAPARWFHR